LVVVFLSAILREGFSIFFFFDLCSESVTEFDLFKSFVDELFSLLLACLLDRVLLIDFEEVSKHIFDFFSPITLELVWARHNLSYKFVYFKIKFIKMFCFYTPFMLRGRNHIFVYCLYFT